MKKDTHFSVSKALFLGLSCSALLLALGGVSNPAEAAQRECVRYKENDEPYLDRECVKLQSLKSLYGHIQIKAGPGAKEQIRKKCTGTYKDTDEPFLDQDCVQFLTRQIASQTQGAAKEASPVVAAHCESVTATEVLCNGVRYVRDSRSVIEGQTEGKARSLETERGSSAGSAGGSAKGSALK